MVAHTPGSAVTGGSVVVVGDTPMVAHRDIAANKLGALSVGGGVYKMTAVEAISAGTDVFWVAASGKVDDSPATGDKHFGIALTASAADGDRINVLHRPNGTASP
jgi:predicted RecA/RadA family phage recombinase